MHRNNSFRVVKFFVFYESMYSVEFLLVQLMWLRKDHGLSFISFLLLLFFLLNCLLSSSSHPPSYSGLLLCTSLFFFFFFFFLSLPFHLSHIGMEDLVAILNNRC